MKDLIEEFKKKNNLENTELGKMVFSNENEPFLDMILSGKKTATCSAETIFHHFKMNIPKADSYCAIYDQNNKVKGIVKITRVNLLKYKEIDNKHANSEGFSCLKVWQEKHFQFFSQIYKKIGKTFSGEENIICIYFVLIAK